MHNNLYGTQNRGRNMNDVINEKVYAGLYILN